MMVVVSYDVSEDNNGRKRLSKVAHICENYGQRVQNSVFECLIDPVEWTNLKNALEMTIDKNVDSLRYYYLGANWKNRVEHIGAKEILDPEGLMLL